MSALVRKLLNYLQSNYSAYHVRATSLIWELDSLSTASHVEAIVARSLTDSDEDLAEAYECFGVFWRLSGSPVAIRRFYFTNNSRRRHSKSWIPL